MRPPRRDVEVRFDGEPEIVSTQKVAAAVRAVLAGEGVDTAEVSVAFVSPERIRDLNRQHFARADATDVIAFSLPHPGVLVGDVYVCPAVARVTARDSGVSDEEELLRLVVHGTLHVLGYDHPEGHARLQSPMWRVQERYLVDLKRDRS